MTKEDAIDIIKSECYVFNPLNFDRSTMVNTALDMAVKALKQEPSDDCISREAAIKAFGDVHPMDYNTQAYITNIQNLPSVTPKPKIGRWIPRSHVFGVAYCSECDFELKIDDTNYCPNCGAKMESEEV